MEQLFTNRKFHFCSHRNFRVFFLNGKCPQSAFFPLVKYLHTRKTSNGGNFGWLIRQVSINQKSGRQNVSGSLFVSSCPPECYLQSETEIEPDLWLGKILTDSRHGPTLSIFFSERRAYCISSMILESNQRYHWLYKFYWKEKGEKPNISCSDGRHMFFYKYNVYHKTRVIEIVCRAYETFYKATHLSYTLPARNA